MTPGKLHPIEVFRAMKPHVGKHPDTVLICDGGEFAQWGQSVLPVVPRRLINGVGGSIGSSLPMAGAACVIEREAPVFGVNGFRLTAGDNLSVDLFQHQPFAFKRGR